MQSENENKHKKKQTITTEPQTKKHQQTRPQNRERKSQQEKTLLVVREKELQYIIVPIVTSKVREKTTDMGPQEV